MRPVLQGLTVTTIVLLSSPALAEVCDKVSPPGLGSAGLCALFGLAGALFTWHSRWALLLTLPVGLLPLLWNPDPQIRIYAEIEGCSGGGFMVPVLCGLICTLPSVVLALHLWSDGPPRHQGCR